MSPPAASIASQGGCQGKHSPEDMKREVDHHGNVQADHTLESLGYTPQLSRNRSTAHVAFMSFVLASIPYGLATTLYYPLVGGGPVTIIWGWLGVSLIIVCVAASLGEITSVYPTAGGVYYQTFVLAPVRWRRIASWICGWLFLVGNITITLAAAFGSSQLLISCINIFAKEPDGVLVASEAYQVFLIFVGIILVCNIVSAFGNRWLPWLDTAAILWTFAGMIAIVICVLVLARHGRNSAEYVFTYFESSSGWPLGWSFCVGLLHAGYATSSTGMVISMCEEVREPAVQVPRAMIITVLTNTFAGLLFLIPLVYVLPDIQGLLSLPQPVPYILKSAVGSSAGAFCLLLPIILLAITSGIGCTTATSRFAWALARDGAIPGSKWLLKINKKLDIPLNSIIFNMIIELVLGTIYFGSPTAFNAFSGVGVICLTASYAVPIIISLATGRRKVKGGRFYLGRLGYACNFIAIAWSLLALPLFCMPPAIPVQATTVNYAPVVFVAATLVSGAWYWLWGHRNFVGPPV